MKKKVKILNKILIVLMILLMLNNFFTMLSSNAVIERIPEAIDDTIGEEGQGFFLTFLGLLTLPVRAITLGLGRALNALTAAVAYIEGATEADVDTTTITPFDIFFNKVKILDINFFEIGSNVNIVNTIRSGIAAWYYTLRLIAMAILLVILIYIGIRMAISTIASEKARYQKMLVDWVASLVLIFLINYIIIFVITLNNTVVSAIEKGVQSESIAETYDTIRNLGFKWADIDSIPATVIYCTLIVQVFGLMITYFNRMLKVAFLIIISPLITLTYAVDKMGDGKAQAFGNWIREFIFTVITQIFHCIIYMSMINIAFELLIEHAGKGVRHALVAAVMSILCVNFTRTAENLTRKILMHNHQDNSVSFAGGTAAAAVALQKSKSLGVTARKTANITRQNLKAAGNAIKGIPNAARKAISAPKKGIQAISRARQTEKVWKEYAKENGIDKSTDKKAYKAEKYRVKGAIKANLDEPVLKTTSEKARKRAEKAAAKRKKQDDKETKRNDKVKKKNDSKFKNFRGKISRIASESDALQFVGKVAKGYTASGVGLLTGSMMYGATGNVGQAFAIGMAGKNATTAFLKTASTMEGGTISSLIAAGARNKEEAFALLNAIASNPELFDGKSKSSVKQAEALLKKIGDELENSIGSPEYKKTIKNTIDQATRANPERMPAVIDSLFKDSEGNPKKDSMGNPLKDNKKLIDACNDYATFANMKQIYAQMEAGQEMGISKDQYVQDCTERFVNLETQSTDQMINDGEVSNNEILNTLTNRTPEYVESIVGDMDDNLKNNIIRQINKEYGEVEKEKENASEDMKEYYEEQLKALDNVHAEILASIPSEKINADRVKEAEVLKRVEEECNKEIEQLLKQLNITNIDPRNGSYLKQARSVANISEADKNVSIDDIIAQRQKDINSGKKSNIDEEKIAKSIENAKIYKQIQSATDRKVKMQQTRGKIKK